MSRPNDSFFPRILIRPRVTAEAFLRSGGTVEGGNSGVESDFSATVQQMIVETEQALVSIQESVPVSIRDYHSLVGKGEGLVNDREIMLRAIRAIAPSSERSAGPCFQLECSPG